MRRLQFFAGFLMISAAAFGQADPPSRVARLNFLQGPVSFRPATVDDWTAATVNYPLTTGDHLWSDQAAQAEMHIGSTAIRLGQMTALSVLNLNDQIVQLSLTQGSVNIHVRYLAEGENYEIDTPNVAINLRPGDYRIDADGDNNVTGIIVHSGGADVTAGQSGTFSVRNGEMARLTGVDSVQQEISGAPALDGFDNWCAGRDAREDRATVSARYVPRETIGYEDLDSNGRWVNIPPYGMVWQPNVAAAGWAPYRQGHWAWVEPWGWTWIDDMPWGFAPFHYGRWAYTGGGWYWVPGVVTVRPVYSPALVAFVGGGGIGVGVAAWFPLGPGEVFRPGYHVTDVYVRNVNVAYVRDVTVINRVEVGNAVYVNQRVVGAVTVVPHEVFVGARPVAAAAVVVAPGVIVSARVVGYTAPLAPERVSVLARPAGVAVVVRTPPTVVVQRTVVVRAAAPPPPVSFAARQEALRANPGHPLDQAQLNTLRATQPQRPQYVRSVNTPAGGSQPMGFGRNRPSNTTTPTAPATNAAPPRNDRPTTATPTRTYDRPANANPPAGESRPNNNAQQPRTTEQRPAETERKTNERGETRNENTRNNDRKKGEKRGDRNDKTDKK